MFLSPKSFEPYTSLKSEDSVREGRSLCDIKIDVYYNGALLSSKTVAKGFAGSKHLNQEQIVRISGLPTGKQSERALSFVPPGQTPDGNLQMNKRNKETSLNRWRKISRMLDLEALRLPPSSASIADGLRGLSKFEIPGEILRMHKAGRTYSMIDVIVTSGNLQKPIRPPLPEPQEATRRSRNVAVVTPEKSARPNVTLEAPAEPSHTVSGMFLSSPNYIRRSQTSKRRRDIGYVETFDPPQQTVEQQFRAIQAAAESPTKTPAEESKVTKRARLTRSKTPALAINDVSSAPHKSFDANLYKISPRKNNVESHEGLDTRPGSSKKLSPLSELATPKTKDSKSFASPCRFPRLLQASI